MCGIAGIAGRVGESKNRELVSDMLEIMRHRGPDSQGTYTSKGIYLGHCRLAINDLSDCAKQPFVSSDRKIAVAVNGEIYNFQDIKRRLIARGYTFQSHSDSEVILHGYIEYGVSFISKLNGMFAISIWDGRDDTLILIRDRLGIKPLYYAETKGGFIFASEIKALALCDDLDLSMDHQSFAEYLAYENYFSNRTLNEHIKLVEPGEIVKFRVQDKTIKRVYFWQPDMGTSKSTGTDNLYDAYIRIAESSVERHLLSEVPVGCYLSTGIDSSSVAYWASQRLHGNLRTYTGAFGRSGFYDEATDAAKLATIFGCENSRIEICPEDFTKNIGDILWHLDEPRVGMGSFSQYMVAKQAAKEVKVILTGHGGDEFFAGYPVFKAIYGKQNVLKMAAHSSFRELMFFTYFSLFPRIKKELSYFLPNIYPLKSFRKILDADFYHTLTSNSDIYRELNAIKNTCNNEYQQLTMTYLKLYLPSLFIVEDKISMAFSLESRTPLCDNELLDFALSISLSEKLNGYELKHIPRTAMRGLLPDFIFNLPKRGFPTPLRYWFKRELREYIRSFIHDNMSVLSIFNQKEVARTVNSYQNSKVETPFDEIYAHRIWIILNLIFYFKNQKQRYKIKP